MRLRWRFTIIIAVMTVATVAATDLLLVHSLQDKDLSEAKAGAVSRAMLIKAGLVNTMINTGDYDKIKPALDEMKATADVDFRIVRAPHVVRLFGLHDGEEVRYDEERQALATGQMVESMPGEQVLRLAIPIVTDERCARCHLDLHDEPVTPGTINGILSIDFNLAERSRQSFLLTSRILMAITGLLLLSSWAILVAVRRQVTAPMERIAAAVADLREERFELTLPRYGVHEIDVMGDAIRTAARQMAQRKEVRDKELEEQRRINEEVVHLIDARAKVLGIEEESERHYIVERLTHAIDEVERDGLIKRGLRFVTREDAQLRIPTDPVVIPPVALYLASLIEQIAREPVRRRAIELALEEALANAIFHGNMELTSPETEEEMERFDDEVVRRTHAEPYGSRTVTVRCSAHATLATFTITDEGPGFDWAAKTREETESERSSGRGLLILRTLTSSMRYNSRGNELTITFDLRGREAPAAT